MTVRDVLPPADALGLAGLIHIATTDSTMDVAHALASEGAAAGTLVIADSQVRGRGRAGRTWASAAGDGLWMTLLERPTDRDATGVLALRVGLAVADAAQPYVDGAIRLKWPNDLFVAGKLAGILVEARWRQSTPDWVAIGVGLNMRTPAEAGSASAVRPGLSRGTLLAALIPALRAACRATGVLTTVELVQWHRRDLARGRRIVSPVEGTVQGIAADGALLVCVNGVLTPVHSGSLLFPAGETV